MSSRAEEIYEIFDPNKNGLVIIFLSGAFSKLFDEIYSDIFKHMGYLRYILFLITFVIFYYILTQFCKKQANKVKKFMERWKKSEIEILKKSEIESKIHENVLDRKYKGMITFVSTPPRSKTSDQQWIAECKKEIDRYPESKTEILGLPGIGQTFRAIFHHGDELNHIWLVHTKESLINIQIIDYFLKNVIKRALPFTPIEIKNPNDVVDVKAIVDGIYKELPKKIESKNIVIETKDVIADITSGTKIMTSAMFLSCLPPNRKIEYVEQKNNELIEVSISPVFTGLELESSGNSSQQN